MLTPTNNDCWVRLRPFVQKSRLTAKKGFSSQLAGAVLDQFAGPPVTGRPRRTGMSTACSSPSSLLITGTQVQFRLAEGQ